MGRPVVHWELMSKDPANVSAFYEKLFDWKIQHMPEVRFGAMQHEPGMRSGPYWQVYVSPLC
ncbi:MAG: hypothetical protein HY574_08000 [candidate division NC10 bacterium]|nr:hypothetical protein [candidate division NC10 bacterium]